MKRIILILLSIYILGTAAAFAVCPKQEYSVSERRRLADKPVLSVKSIYDGSFSNDLETYLLDRFPFRDALRSLKAHFASDILRQKENNGIYIANGHASKLEYPLNEAEAERAVEMLLALKKNYFSNNNVFYTVIPDKNYFLASQNGYPHMDYERLLEILNKGLGNELEYIDIFPALEIDDYYKTDTHWRQEYLDGVVSLLLKGLGCEEPEVDFNLYEKRKIEDFYGIYRGQAALPFPAEEIIYLTNEVTDNAEVYDAETDSIKKVYQTELLSDGKSMDSYDIFLGGARAVLTIRNTLFEVDEEKRLIIFRDSFGSSLAPLLLEQYSEIVLADLRYISARHIGEYVDFENADILFAYNTLLWNSASILKK